MLRGSSSDIERVTNSGLVRRFGRKCHFCRCSLKNRVMHGEHLVPLSRGGATNYENMRPSCPDCNHMKHTRTEAEFFRMLLHSGYFTPLEEWASGST